MGATDMLKKCVDKRLFSTANTVWLALLLLFGCLVASIATPPSYHHLTLCLTEHFPPRCSVPDEPCILQTVNPAFASLQLIIYYSCWYAFCFHCLCRGGRLAQYLAQFTQHGMGVKSKLLLCECHCFVDPTELFLLAVESRSFSSALAWIKAVFAQGPLISVQSSAPACIQRTHTCTHIHNNTLYVNTEISTGSYGAYSWKD